MDNPILSVIIPVYNAERFLVLCLDSILSAGINELEILLVDDGSTDNSLHICNEYQAQHPCVRVLAQKNAGPSAARNLALSQARGEYIAFIDSDDYVDSVAFAHRIELVQSGNADIWASNFHRVADNGYVLDRVYQIETTDTPIVGKEYVETFFAARDCVWNVWRYVFRRDFLEKNHLRFAEGFHMAEDLEFVIRAFSLCETAAFYHEPYYFYRVNYGASLTRQWTAPKVQQLLTMLQSASGYLGSDSASKALKAKLAREYILHLSTIYEVSRPEREMVRRNMIEAEKLAEAAQGVYRLTAKGAQWLGISATAWMLYRMKLCKRAIRKVKTVFFFRD